MSTAVKAFQNLIGSQLEAFARVIASKNPGVDVDAAVEMASQHAAKLDLNIAAKGKGKRTRKSGPSKPKKPLTAEERCMARTWGTGSGEDQCSRRRAGDECGDFCTLHFKQSALCSDPCTLGENGKRHGLWLGRIDHAIPCADSNDVVRIEWSNGKGKEAVAAAVENGATLPAGKPKKAKKVKKAALSTGANAEAEDFLGDSTSKKTFAIKKSGVALLKSLQVEPETNEDAQPKPAKGQAVPEQPKEKAAPEQTQEKVASEQTQEKEESGSVSCANDAGATNEEEEDDAVDDSDDEGVSVHYEHDDEGAKYMVDDDGNVYNEDCEVIGTWNKETKCVDAAAAE